MELSKLPKITQKSGRRLGQGHGSGRGKTAGRGTKGQKSRGKVGLFFEGGALPLTKRLPFLRGRGRNKVRKIHLKAVNIATLSSLPSKTTVDVETLIKLGLVDKGAEKSGVKIIGNTEVKSSLTVKLPVSASARKNIESAGGTVA